MKMPIWFVIAWVALLGGVCVALNLRDAAREANSFDDGYGQTWSVRSKGQDGAIMCYDNGNWDRGCQHMSWETVTKMFHGKVHK